MNTREPALSPKPRLSELARQFLDAPRFGVIAVLNPDGSPLQAVIWYRLDGDTVVFNSRVGRRWPANLERDRRVSITVADGYRYVELRGEVEVDTDPVRGQEVIADLARRYRKNEAVAEAQIEGFAKERRITFELRPTCIFERIAGR